MQNFEPNTYAYIVEEYGGKLQVAFLDKQLADDYAIHLTEISEKQGDNFTYQVFEIQFNNKISIKK
jgi:hypothetical protein